MQDNFKELLMFIFDENLKLWKQGIINNEEMIWNIYRKFSKQIIHDEDLALKYNELEIEFEKHNGDISWE